MPVDISDVLHVLAHELRTPTGIAQGYVRMLLEERLTDPRDRQRALEATRSAVSRISELTQETSKLANWLEADHTAMQSIDAAAFVQRVVDAARVDPPLVTKCDIQPDEAVVSTPDTGALVDAVVALVRATARELRRQPCALLVARLDRRMMEVLIAPDDQLSALAAGPHAPSAGPIALERGGVGLSLVMAAAVFAAHDVAPWTVDRRRTAIGIRLPIEERAHP